MENKDQFTADTPKKILLDTDISDIEQRLFAATSGNWYAIIEGRDQTSGSSFIMTNVENANDTHNPNRGEDLYLIGATTADMDFIAHARQDIPRLLAEIQRLKIIINKA
jgi:hypothetical protein